MLMMAVAMTMTVRMVVIVFMIVVMNARGGLAGMRMGHLACRVGAFLQ